MKLNYKRTFCVGFAFFLICAFWQAYDTLLPKILTDKFGLSQSWSGAVMALDNVLALFLLPLFGSLSDKTKSRAGRRTPYIVIGTILAAVSFLALSYGDYLQLSKLSSVSAPDQNTLAVLYDTEYGKELRTPDGESYIFSEEEQAGIRTWSREEFLTVQMEITAEDGSVKTNPDYLNYVVPARQAYAWQQTVASPSTLIFFMALLLLVLVSMGSFRSPAVALMPDVTIKPLRSKGNAVINLMGAAGGIIVLALGLVFGTGKVGNALMSYTPFFFVIAGIMLVSLGIFVLTVREPRFVKEMQEESARYHLEDGEEAEGGSKKLSRGEFTSLLLILASVVLWYMGYNAVSSKYSVYAGKVLNLDYNLTLMIANGAAILSYLPVGILSSRLGRRKMILAGVALLGGSFTAAAFMRAGSPVLLMNFLFAMAGVGWATINVNSYPMVVELAKGSDVGKYTGFYYTASMAAQTLTPIFSGMLMDWKFTSLFPYAAVFVALSFVTMLFVRHGDSKPEAKVGLEAFEEND